VTPGLGWDPDTPWVVPGMVMLSALHEGPVPDPTAGFQKKSRTAPRAETPLLARSDHTNEGIPKYDFDAWAVPVVAATGTSPGVKMAKKIIFGAFRGVFRPF